MVVDVTLSMEQYNHIRSIDGMMQCTHFTQLMYRHALLLERNVRIYPGSTLTVGLEDCMDQGLDRHVIIWKNRWVLESSEID